jgi:hypothetical protein
MAREEAVCCIQQQAGTINPESTQCSGAANKNTGHPELTSCPNLRRARKLAKKGAERRNFRPLLMVIPKKTLTSRTSTHRRRRML